MADPFHLSFLSDDLARAKAFYTALGCPVGRERATWFDLDFFGHQVTIHQAPRGRKPAEGSSPTMRTLDHFGINLDKDRWQALLERIETHGVEFRVRPKQANVGQPDEKGKFMIADPDGVGLEFKYSLDST